MKAIEHIEHALGRVEKIYATKPMRYLVGGIEFLIAWCMVAVAVGFAILYFFPPQRGAEPMFLFGWDWRNLPGALLGLIAGILRFRASVRGSKA
jgi:hypothetical protein